VINVKQSSWATSEFQIRYPRIPHWCSSVFGCRKACGLADTIEIDRFITEAGKGPYPDME